MHHSSCLELRVSNWLSGAVVALLLLVGNAALAAGMSPDGIWNDVAESTIARGAQGRQIVPQSYRSVRLSRGQLELQLSRAPMERDVAVAQSDARLWLPLPGGEFGEFRIVESPIMEDDLAKRYPQIRTWLGQGIDDPTATLRFDVTPKGFHAQIISAHGTVFVDPYQPGDIENYIAYNKHDHARAERPRCEVTGEELVDGVLHTHAADADVQISSGATLRTYRLAMAATGEYTAFHGGTVVDGLAGVITTVNRVNGIYEREISVRMVLVANNDLIIYTNAATDPYANTAGDLGANQTNLTNVIGSANYDIGHLMGTGGGGVAGLGVVCINSQKARGLTGSGAPIGDSFDVDFVAHEMGHQFAGNHTFNGSGSNCSGGNRNASTAYEPGSGITIQAYAGICGGDNLQPNSEDYFHRISLNEMIGFTTTGSGSTCGTTSATGNTEPTVSAVTPTITIPRSTPFELDAIGVDGDGDELTYLWEQFNLGVRNSTGVLVDNGGPLFRSFTPTQASSRVFPSLRYILNNANVAPATAPLPGTASPNYFTAELLPSTNRTMNFRVTVRDNRAGGGGTNEATAAVTVTTAAGPFLVTTPNTAVTWTAGAVETVNWDVANTDLAPLNTALVRILLSLDGGHTWPEVLALGVPNTGTANVTVPAGTPSTTQARIRVEAVGNIYFDVSDTNFTINGTNSPPSVSVTGLVATRQGSPTASATVATVNDAEDGPGGVSVSVSGAPPELDVSVMNVDGSVTLAATASCTLVAPSGGVKVYPVLLRATDSQGASTAAFVNVTVARNFTPTLGNYAPISVAAGNSVSHAPSAAAADANFNLDAVLVSPSVLPGGGTLSAAMNGTVDVNSVASTTEGVYPIRVQVSDTCGATEMRQFSLTIEPAPVIGVTIVQSGGTTNVAEGGASDTYTLVLNLEPSADVQITLAGDDDVNVTPNTLDFTTANWNVPQQVTVSAVDDRIVEGAHAGTIAHSAVGGDYTGVEIDDVVVAVLDNDSATYQFSPGSSSVSESGGSANIDVTLGFNVSGAGDIELASPVTVPFSIQPASTATGGGEDYSLAIASVDFPIEGGTQSILVTLVDDNLVEGDETLVLGLGQATGAAPELLAVVSLGNPSVHTLSILDDEVAGVTLTETDGGTAVVEGGATDTYSFVLDAQPSGDVQISASPDAQLGVEPSLLIFTMANWDVPQQITVTAADDGVIEGAHTGSISHTISGGGYSGVSLPDLVVDITDSELIADIAVTNQVVAGYWLAGQPVGFDVTLSNLSNTVDVPVVNFDFVVTPELEGVQWTCTPSAGASCPSDGDGVPSHDVVLERDSSVFYSISGIVPAGSASGTEFVATASAFLSPPYADPDLSNNTDEQVSSVTTIDIFSDSFEDL